MSLSNVWSAVQRWICQPKLDDVDGDSEPLKLQTPSNACLPAAPLAAQLLQSYVYCELASFHPEIVDRDQELPGLSANGE